MHILKNKKADNNHLSNNKKADIDYFILHQANVYIVETILKKLNIPFEKAPSKVFAKYGNQNSASIPSARAKTIKIEIVVYFDKKNAIGNLTAHTNKLSNKIVRIIFPPALNVK